MFGGIIIKDFRLNTDDVFTMKKIFASSCEQLRQAIEDRKVIRLKTSVANAINLNTLFEK